MAYQGNNKNPIINILYNPIRLGKGMEISEELVNCPFEFLGIYIKNLIIKIIKIIKIIAQIIIKYEGGLNL